jgi:hypothetical protein
MVRGMNIIDIELAKRIGFNLGEKIEIQGKILFKVVDIYDGDRVIRGKKYKQSIITFPAILRKTIFKRSKKFLVYFVFAEGKPALLFEPVVNPTKEDIEEFLKALAERSVSEREIAYPEFQNK